MIRNLLLIPFFLLPLYSCSLKYDSETDLLSDAPEFSFRNVIMTGTEDGKVSMKMAAARMEQYRDENAMYARDIRFTLFNTNGEITLEGSCGLLSADSEKDEYGLFSNVEICSYEQNMKIQGQNIRWNNKTEQLTSGTQDVIHIASGDTDNSENSGENPGAVYATPQNNSQSLISISGSGFSASGVSMEYAFGNPVSGMISTADTGSAPQETGIEDNEPGTAYAE